MIAFLNGQFLPEAQARVSILDRSFLYGDGLFETLRISEGRPFRWAQHLDRLARGARVLGIKIPYSPEELATHCGTLLQRARVNDSLLRITLSRGVGPTGYSPRAAHQPTIAMSLRPSPALDAQTPCSWQMVTASSRLMAADPLAQLKTCNKLPQILARAEAETAGADEALLLNTEGAIAEASSANVFWVRHGAVCTPPLSSGALAGVTRAAVFELCVELGIKCAEVTSSRRALFSAEGVFLSLTSWGIIEVAALDGRGLRRSPLVKRLYQAYLRLLQ